MDTEKDIETRKEIEDLMRSFYSKVLNELTASKTAAGI